MKTFTLKVMEPLSWLHGRPSSGRQLLLPVALFVASSGLMIDSADGGTHYVWQSSPSPAAPFTNWTTAATSIQEAVDVADAGDEILVTNGVYATGGRALSGTMTNRVTVNKALTLRSINGPQVTIIEGYQVPGAINGDGAIRCVYLTNGARLSGFTLRNGATTTNGWEELSGGGVWCEPVDAVVSNCFLVGNSAAYDGGGAYQGTLVGCTLSANAAGQEGGGAQWAVLNNCVLTGNTAHIGGGAGASTLNNCTLIGNTARYEGGGAYYCSLGNCIIYNNIAAVGPNYFAGNLNFCCTIPLPANGAGNVAADPQLASLSHIGALSPCRGAGSRDYASGTDIDGEAWANEPSIGCDEYVPGSANGPLRVGFDVTFTNVAVRYAVRLTARVEGRVTATVWEIDGNPVATNCPYTRYSWGEPGDHGLVLRSYNESYPEGVNASVTIHVLPQPVHYVASESAGPVPPYTSWATAATNIQDAIDASILPGGMVLVSNGVYSTGGRAIFGTMTNRVAVDKPVIVRSANGPRFTTIRGYQVPATTNGDGAIRCVYLASGASLSGFMLDNGATRSDGDRVREQSGGGIWSESLLGVASNCVVEANSAKLWGGAVYGASLSHSTIRGNSAGAGGGACMAALDNCWVEASTAGLGGGVAGGTLDSCTLTNNHSRTDGGGAHESTLSNCTVADNSAGEDGGGVIGGTLVNCIMMDNTAGSRGGGAYASWLDNCRLTGNVAGNGGGACAATLSNCFIAFNSAWNGGGVAGGTLRRCILTGNSATNNGGGAAIGAADPGRPPDGQGSSLYECTLTNNAACYGGGAYGGSLENCLVIGNWATNGGGGACASEGPVVGSGFVPVVLKDCTLVRNTAQNGGGVFVGVVNNCVLYSNVALTNANYDASVLNYTCTLPLPPSGEGNITNAPLFVGELTGNLRLQSNSPCINSGFNAFTDYQVDLDGNPRIVSGTVDIGAYEYQGPGSVISYAWLQQYRLPTDGSADRADTDADGQDNWQEWRCWTNPTNAASALRLVSVSRTGDKVTVVWESMAGATYFLERCTNMGAGAFFVPMVAGVPGEPGTTAYEDTDAAGASQFFYRVGIGDSSFPGVPDLTSANFGFVTNYGTIRITGYTG